MTRYQLRQVRRRKWRAVAFSNRIQLVRVSNARMDFVPRHIRGAKKA